MPLLAFIFLQRKQRLGDMYRINCREWGTGVCTHRMSGVGPETAVLTSNLGTQTGLMHGPPREQQRCIGVYIEKTQTRKLICRPPGLCHSFILPLCIG
jgi:hypothetical protein